jgi:hypothetical protein
MSALAAGARASGPPIAKLITKGGRDAPALAGGIRRLSKPRLTHIRRSR